MTTPFHRLQTGIPGLDVATRGGLPSIGTTLVLGGPGSGKTTLALQIVAGSVDAGAHAVVVSFEEAPRQLQRSAGSFTWGDRMGSSAITFLDARPHLDGEVAGAFDLLGLLAVLDAEIEAHGPRVIVLDGIDQLFAGETDELAHIREVWRIDEWARERELAVILTAKAGDFGRHGERRSRAIEFLLGTVLEMSITLDDRKLRRHLRISKFRGSSHATDAIPVVIDDSGIHLSFIGPATSREVSTERVSSGIADLDDVLGGGIYRDSTLLLSGAPGTSKSTLAASFALAAVERGERALLVSFDEQPNSIVRNVASVGIDLAPHVESGALVVRGRAAWAAPSERHVLRIQQLLDEVKPGLLVIDPISALLKAGDPNDAYVSVEYLLSLTRARGITCVLTALSETPGETEATLSHASTIADTWVTLAYRIAGGERNRALSVVKSRGTAHSNQVRELILSNEGVALAEVFRFGTEVRMGTARLHAEAEANARKRVADRERRLRRRELEERLGALRERQSEAVREAERIELALESEAQEAASVDRIESLYEQVVLAHRRGPARRTILAQEHEKES